MKIASIAILILAIFIAVWIFFVVPAEKRHHERKLAALQKKIESRQSTETVAATPSEVDASGDGQDKPEDPGV